MTNPWKSPSEARGKATVHTRLCHAVQHLPGAIEEYFETKLESAQVTEIGAAKRRKVFERSVLNTFARASL